ncbi:MAG: DNA-processing protein DprA [Candidatus Paracaedibacteraceae bacterium]|nr:DNA-processing protein DprA [Candidatus Paracaedibacteraceae bacterium]
MMEKQLISWLKLAHSKNVGPVTFWQAIERFGDCEAALGWLKSNGRAEVIPTDRSIHHLINECHKKNVTLVIGEDPCYPARLKELRDAPAVLFVKGQVDRLQSEMVGIVGARNCSFMAKKQAQILAENLGKVGLTIVSGLARGVDRSAHLGSLESGTVAVVAGGVDIIYPPEHEELYHNIQQNGCIISEMPIGMKPSSTHFPRRNRIISGLSDGVIVVEAAMKSGSLITAKYALEQSREVFAVPGTPQDPRCHGSNHLLKQGAHLVQTVEDIIRVLKPEFDLNTLAEPEAESYVASHRKFAIPATLKEEILLGLNYTPIDINFIAEDFRLSTQEVMAIILELELEGLIVRQANGTVSISNLVA